MAWQGYRSVGCERLGCLGAKDGLAVEIVVGLVLVVAVPVGLLWWTRRGRTDIPPGSDPEAHRNAIQAWPPDGSTHTGGTL